MELYTIEKEALNVNESTVKDSYILVLDFVNSKHLVAQTLLLYVLARHFYMVDNGRGIH